MKSITFVEDICNGEVTIVKEEESFRFFKYTITKLVGYRYNFRDVKTKNVLSSGNYDRLEDAIKGGKLYFEMAQAYKKACGIEET